MSMGGAPPTRSTSTSLPRSPITDVVGGLGVVVDRGGSESKDLYMNLYQNIGAGAVAAAAANKSEVSLQLCLLFSRPFYCPLIFHLLCRIL